MTIKERLYKAVIKRELKEKYEVNKDGATISCRSCGASENIETWGKFPIENGKLVQKHYRRCPTDQLERILAI